MTPFPIRWTNLIKIQYLLFGPVGFPSLLLPLIELFPLPLFIPFPLPPLLGGWPNTLLVGVTGAEIAWCIWFFPASLPRSVKESDTLLAIPPIFILLLLKLLTLILPTSLEVIILGIFRYPFSLGYIWPNTEGELGSEEAACLGVLTVSVLFMSLIERPNSNGVWGVLGWAAAILVCLYEF